MATAVLARYGANTSLAIGDELAQWLFLYIVFLAIPVAHAGDDHVAFTACRLRLGRRAEAVAALLARTILVWTTLRLLIHGWRLMLLIGGTSPAMELPYWLLQWVVPVSALLSLAMLLLRDLRDGAAGQGAAALAAALALQAALAWLGPPWAAGTSPCAVLMASFALAFLLAVPIAFAMLFAAFAAHLGAAALPGPAVIQNLMKGSGQHLLLAIPFFLTAANLMNIGGLTGRILDLAAALIGHLRGGFAQINVVSSLLYGGMSGSSAADAALDTKVMVPQMVRAGYGAPFSARSRRRRRCCRTSWRRRCPSWSMRASPGCRWASCSWPACCPACCRRRCSSPGSGTTPAAATSRANPLCRWRSGCG